MKSSTNLTQVRCLSAACVYVLLQSPRACGSLLITAAADLLTADDHSRITGQIVQEVLQRLGNGSAGADLIQAFDSFDLPKVRFDPIRQRFYPLSEPLTIHGNAQVANHTAHCVQGPLLAVLNLGSLLQDRFCMYLDRLLLLYQRLRRDRTFSRPALADASMEHNAAYCQVLQHAVQYCCCMMPCTADACCPEM